MANSLIVVVLAATVVSSCGSSEATTPVSSTTLTSVAAPSTSSTTTSTTEAPQRKQISFAVPYLPTNLNPNTPAGDSSVTREIMANIWPSVFFRNAKYQQVLNSSFVSSAELVSTNPEKVIYKINPSASWSDGVAISAADFVYNWKAQSGELAGQASGASQSLPNSTVGYSDIKSVTGSNNGKTVTVVFKKHFSEWESLFNPLVPAHMAEQVGWNSGFTQISPLVEVSGGPYEISAMNPGKGMELTRNPDYWGKAASIPIINFVDAPDPAQYPALFESGAINLVHATSSNLLYSGLKALRGVTTKLVPSLNMEDLIFNVSAAPLSDLNVREAIALAIDRKAIVDAVLGSYDPKAGPTGNNIYSPGPPEYQNHGKKYLTANPKAAISLLKSDGYSLSKAGIMEKAGKPLVLSLSVDNSNQDLLYVQELITEELSAIGIVVNSLNYPLTSLVSSVLSKGTYQMAIVNESGSPAASFHVGRYSSRSDSNDNYMKYSNPQADSLISEASGKLDPASSAAVYNQLDQLIWKDLPTIPLYSVPNVLAYDTGYNFIGASTMTSTIFWNASTWSFTPPK